MKKKHFLYWKNGGLLIASIFIFLVSCKGNGDAPQTYDPSKPVEFDEFLPKEGGVGTKLVIRGANFGSDTALVRVYVNDKSATVIGVADTRIYAVVPRRADIGPVRVEIGKDAEKQTYTFEENFDYEFSQVVSTLCGYTNNDGGSEIVNGRLDEARFIEPRTLKVDAEGDIYLIESNRGLRVISQTRNEVTSPFRGSGSMSNPVMLDFSLDQKTLYITNESGNDNGTGVFTVTRDNGFMNARELLKARSASDIAVNPVDGTIFYAIKAGGTVYRYDKETRQSVVATTLGDNNFVSLAFTRDGKILYLIGADTNAIYKSNYNFQTKGLDNPTIFAGTQFSSGHADGVGTAARFWLPFQGAVDEEGNLFVAELLNHTIRKITPDGMVSTFAGVPQKKGFLDGKPLDAKFNEPMGVAFDQDGTLYVADAKNHRIRMIKYE